MSKIMKSNFIKPNKGFVALFTVLIAAVILSMAVGISNIALKQILLSASATDANKSFYAADSGIECALYNDLGVSPSEFIPNQTTFLIGCLGQNIFVSEPTSGYFLFEIDYGDSCAEVSVFKPDIVSTEVISTGSNMACGLQSSRRVERVIRVTY